MSDLWRVKPMRRDVILDSIIRPALQMLPAHMRGIEAEQMLLAIGYQESKFIFRRQLGGPARGFWQFETNGVAGVLGHFSSGRIAEDMLTNMAWPKTISHIHAGLEYGDIMACIFARLLLYTDSEPLPDLRDDPEMGWAIYLRTWRPAKPHHDMWRASLVYAIEIL